MTDQLYDKKRRGRVYSKNLQNHVHERDEGVGSIFTHDDSKGYYNGLGGVGRVRCKIR